MQQNIAVFDTEVQPETEHPAVFLRNHLQFHGNLRNAEQDIQQLKRRNFRRIRAVPFEHVRMNCGRSRRQTQVKRAHTVRKHVRRAVRRTEHIPVLADRRADIALAELNQNIRVDCAQTAHRFGKQKVDSLGQALDVASRIVLRNRRVFAVKTYRIDEVQLEAVDSPFTHGVFIDVDQILADFREARVENRRVQPFPFIEVFSLEMLICPAVHADERNREPDDIFHAEFMDFRDMGGHIGETAFGNLPVAAERIAALVVVCLPAVVDDDSLHAVLFRKRAFRLQLLVENLLMIAVPGRINRLECGGGRR